RAGRLVMISGKSGHYKPDMNALLNCVRTLEKQGLPVRAAKVRLYRKGPDGHPLRDADGTRRDPVTGAVVEKDKSMPVYVSGWEFLTGKPHEKYCAWGH